MVRVAIIDYEAGNLFNVERACSSVGLSPVITNRPEEIFGADALILPGVGAFGKAMEALDKLDMIQALKDFAASGNPFMGVCLGMQLLFSKSEEFGEHEGLGLIEGEVIKFPSVNNDGDAIKIPQVCWNQIFVPAGSENAWDHTPLEGTVTGEFMYFVHSFYARPSLNENILAVTDYGGIKYCSAVIKDNIFATQFHPEKSGESGLKIYRDWASRIIGKQKAYAAKAE